MWPLVQIIARPSPIPLEDVDLFSENIMLPWFATRTASSQGMLDQGSKSQDLLCMDAHNLPL